MTRRGVPGAPRRPDISSTGSVVRASGWPRWHSVRARTTATPNRGRQMTSEPRTQPRSALGAAARYSLLVGPLLSMIDSSIVNVAVPDIARELTATLDTVQWVVSGYLLALGVALAATSYLAKRFGTLRVYTISMVAFVLASAGCAIAPNISLLIAARGLQGLVGAPLVPLALSILLGKDGLSGGKVPISAALTLFLAPALVPTHGGLLIGAGGWRWIFLINLPVGIAGLLLLRRVPRTVGAQRRPHPVVNLHMVMHRDSALALVLQVLCSVVAFGTVFLMPVFTQSIQGHTALQTGLALLPQGVIMGVGTYAGQRLSGRISLRVLVVTGFVILAVASVFLLFLDQSTPLWVTAAILSGRAIAVGFVTTPLLVAMLAPLPESELADGNTLFNISQRLGGSIGVSILGSLIAGGTSLSGVLDSFHFVGAILIGIAVVSALLALRLAPARVAGAPTAEPSGGK